MNLQQAYANNSPAAEKLLAFLYYGGPFVVTSVRPPWAHGDVVGMVLASLTVPAMVAAAFAVPGMAAETVSLQVPAMVNPEWIN